MSEAQREVRAVIRGGLVGQCVSATLWLASALLATVSTPRRAILVLESQRRRRLFTPLGLLPNGFFWRAGVILDTVDEPRYHLVEETSHRRGGSHGGATGLMQRIVRGRPDKAVLEAMRIRPTSSKT